MYSPIVAILVAAANATELPREGSARQKLSVAASQTVRMGERKRSSTLWKKCGWYICQFRTHEENMSKTHNSTISGKSKHHPRVTRHGEKSTMPHTNHDKTHQHHRSIITKHVDENLQYRLTDRT